MDKSEREKELEALVKQLQATNLEKDTQLKELNEKVFFFQFLFYSFLFFSFLEFNFMKKKISNTDFYFFFSKKLKEEKKSKNFVSNELKYLEENAPAKPKRPQTAYILFCADKRGEIRSSNQGKPPPELLKILGQKWQELSEDEKKVTTSIYFHLKLFYIFLSSHFGF